MWLATHRGPCSLGRSCSARILLGGLAWLLPPCYCFKQEGCQHRTCGSRGLRTQHGGGLHPGGGILHRRWALARRPNRVRGCLDAVDRATRGSSRIGESRQKHDELLGRQGRDVLLGGWGPDTLRGESGSDYLQGGAEADRLSGGAGWD